MGVPRNTYTAGRNPQFSLWAAGIPHDRFAACRTPPRPPLAVPRFSTRTRPLPCCVSPVQMSGKMLYVNLLPFLEKNTSLFCKVRWDGFVEGRGVGLLFMLLGCSS